MAFLVYFDLIEDTGYRANGKAFFANAYLV